MSNRVPLKFAAQFVIAAAAVLLLPALWSMFSAVWSAVTTGNVLVVSVGRYETSRALVPWPNGWARFIGPLLLFSSFLVWVASKSGERVAVWWLSAALASVGFLLLLFSQWFTSWRGCLWFGSIAALLVLALYLGNRFGRFAGVLVVVGVFAFILWQVVRSS